MSQVERVAISLPKKLVHRIEELRDRMDLNRSKFYQKALKAYLEEFPGEEDKKLAQLYQEIHQTNQELLRHFGHHSYKHLPPYQQ